MRETVYRRILWDVGFLRDGDGSATATAWIASRDGRPTDWPLDESEITLIG